jgi:hypothetical protein
VNGFAIDTADAVVTEKRLVRDYEAARSALDAALR